METSSLAGFPIQNSRNQGNSSPEGSAVFRARPRAESPYFVSLPTALK